MSLRTRPSRRVAAHAPSLIDDCFHSLSFRCYRTDTLRAMPSWRGVEYNWPIQDTSTEQPSSPSHVDLFLAKSRGSVSVLCFPLHFSSPSPLHLAETDGTDVAKHAFLLFLLLLLFLESPTPASKAQAQSTTAVARATSFRACALASC